VGSQDVEKEEECRTILYIIYGLTGNDRKFKAYYRIS
jgi:hypothetical protein